jgi:hypothetical protein
MSGDRPDIKRKIGSGRYYTGRLCSTAAPINEENSGYRALEFLAGADYYL